MKNRLELAHEMLSKDGTLWVNIDEYENGYLRVLLDEIFGRENYIADIIWQKAFSPVNLKKTISISHDTIYLYAKNIDSVQLNGLPRSEEANDRYSNPDNDPRGPWTSGDLSVGPEVEEKIYPIETPSGRTVYPTEGRCWVVTKERFEEFREDNRIWFGEDGNNVPRFKRFLSEVKDEITPMSLWLRNDVGDNQEAKREVKNLDLSELFGTPKPERLMQRIIHIGSNKGDLVLDFFAGSGTTGAVAHKMGRQYILCEQMDYVEPVTLKRLQKVIDGEQGGISKDVEWQGGGSFVYAELMEFNATYFNEIEDADSKETLQDILERLQENAFLSYKVNPSDIDKEKASFDELTLDQQKQFLIEVLDKNQLYVNYSEIEDEEFGISEEVKQMNHQFYNLK